MKLIKKSDLNVIGETVPFDVMVNSRPFPAFAISTKEGIKAYLNSCPHAKVGLDYDDNEFYHEKLDRIVCKTHGATFIAEDGRCDTGPCSGEKLTALKIFDQGEIIKLVYEGEEA
jgi:nitrite reductase/ring-hydroxylating ferredoxin subunit